MPRKKEQNAELRSKRRLQILDAALSAYIECGFNGTDMDQVALKAGLAKGLVYYYFKSKQELFRAMFEWAFGYLMEINTKLLEANSGTDPVERLARYILAVLDLAEKDVRMLRFSMRLPFDAYAVFGPDEWGAGLARSKFHQTAIAAMIRDIVNAGRIPPVNPERAAASFWAVFMANCFDMTRMIGMSKAADRAAGKTAKAERVRELLGFCFRMLGLSDKAWLIKDKEVL